MISNEKDKQTILDLYFNKFYSYSQILEYFKGKYCYAEVKTFIKKHINKYI